VSSIAEQRASDRAHTEQEDDQTDHLADDGDGQPREEGTGEQADDECEPAVAETDQREEPTRPRRSGRR